MNTTKRGLVHFCGKMFLPRGRKQGKGDWSIFPRRTCEDSGSRRKNGPVPFSGFTLLEVILALAILAGSLAALGEVIRLADQNAGRIEGETQAQIIAASLMDELASGARALTAVNQTSFDTTSDPPWLYSIALEQTDYEELVAVRVLVEQQLDARLQPARFELVRWLPNPDFVLAASEQESSSTTSSSSTSNSTGGGGQP